MTYKQIKWLVMLALANFDPASHDAHVFAWLDHEACNANNLRRAIEERLSQACVVIYSA